jgi:hypothetical protein
MAKSREDIKSKHGPGTVERALRKDNQRLLSDNEKLRQRIGRDEILIDKVASNIEKLGKLPKINRTTAIKTKDEVYNKPLVAVLCIADPHMEEVVDPSETEGLAEWNFNRFLRAAWEIVKKTIDITNIMRPRHKINDLHICWLGDMVTGEIHPDVYHTNAFYLPDALTYGPWYWSQAVRELSSHFETVQNNCVPGNHGRMDKKPSSKRFVGRNFDTCMYQNTAMLTHDLDNVSFFIPRSPKCVVEINGWYFLLQHGIRWQCMVVQHLITAWLGKDRLKLQSV